MHILTGMLVTALLRRHARRKTDGGAPGAAEGTPSFTTGPIRIAHRMPGRVRFRVPTLVGDRGRCEKLAARLRGIEGVHEAGADAVTGSVLVRHDARRLAPDLLLAAIARLLGLEDELRRTPTPVVAREFRQGLTALNRAVLERTGGLVDFQTALMLGLGAVGVHRLLADGARALPTGLTLVWWATNALAGRHRDAVR